MNNVFVYIEIGVGHSGSLTVADVSLELLSKGRELADELGVELECVCMGDFTDEGWGMVNEQLQKFGSDRIHVFNDPRLSPYTTLPHSAALAKLLLEEQAQICLMGATSIGRDLGPRVSSALGSGLTADCTRLEIGDFDMKVKAADGTFEGHHYERQLMQIRPAFGGSIIATIVNPEHRPQMATVRDGVMKKKECRTEHRAEIIVHNTDDYTDESDFAVHILEHHVEMARHNLKGADIVVAGGYGVGSKDGFNMLYSLAKVLHAEVGATRAAVDAGWVTHDRQIGQTGLTVRPKVYIACGISGAIQHIAGMRESGIIISINSDPNAPITKIADYNIVGTIEDVVPKFIKYYKTNV